MDLSIGGNTNRLYQLNASNITRQVTNFTTTNFFVMNHPAIAEGFLYIGNYNGHVFKLNASNISQQIANISLGDGVRGGAAIHNGFLYIGSWNNRVYQINVTDMRQVANFTTGNDIESSPAVANGYVYVTSTDLRMYQLDANNISRQITNFSAGSSFRDASPTVAGGYVYVGNDDNRVYQLDANNISRQIANFTTLDDIKSTPSVAHGYVYIGSNDNNLYQLDASNISRMIANYTTDGDVWGSPTVTDEFVFVPSTGSQFYQFNASNISHLIGTSTISLAYTTPVVLENAVYVADSGSRVWQFGIPNITIGNYTPGSQGGADTTPPTVTLISPQNITYASASPTYNVTLSENGSVQFSLNNGTTNTSMTGDEGTYGTSFHYNASGLADGQYVIRIYAKDIANNSNNAASARFNVSAADADGDGVVNANDTMHGDASAVSASGVGALDVTIAGNASNGTFNGIHEVAFFDGSSKLINFTHDFGTASLNLSKVFITKTSTSLLVNLSGQVLAAYNKTLFVNDPGFTALCVKDAELSSIGDISEDCTGANEINFTSCIGNSTGVTLNGSTCTDSGSVISITNLAHTGVRGTVAAASTTESGGSSKYKGECKDGKDNDGDGFIDNDDADCRKYRNTEGNHTPAPALPVLPAAAPAQTPRPEITVMPEIVVNDTEVAPAQKPIKGAPEKAPFHIPFGSIGVALLIIIAASIVIWKKI